MPFYFCKITQIWYTHEETAFLCPGLAMEPTTRNESNLDARSAILYFQIKYHWYTHEETMLHTLPMVHKETKEKDKKKRKTDKNQETKRQTTVWYWDVRAVSHSCNDLLTVSMVQLHETNEIFCKKCNFTLLRLNAFDKHMKRQRYLALGRNTDLLFLDKFIDGTN